ncbi:MAG TPA: DUF445 family protein [Gammaproteobacteria bacterium]|nr:DUF445 family protein [Gammaproteobacteria bacterium]
MWNKLKARYIAGDKSLITNTVALGIVFIGLLMDEGNLMLAMGLFALSGALTNWLAVHMLFEKVPMMYGSGVVPNRFEEFKTAIKELIMKQFFTEENLTRFIADEEASIGKWLKPGQLVDNINYDKLFDRLVDAIMSSSFGSMLEMIGGAEALQGLKASFIEKIKLSLNEMVASESFQGSVARSIDTNSLSQDMGQKIELIVDKRLSELTPELVKLIVQEMIEEHLGWLVVWGGVVGGVIGVVAGGLM